eukprot:4448914-Alexandrium_andersonii.AAC.1
MPPHTLGRTPHLVPRLLMTTHVARQTRDNVTRSPSAIPVIKTGLGPVSYTHLTLPTICSV